MIDLIKRLKCLLGFHDWRRSMFVVLGSRVADFHCTRCRKWRDGETATDTGRE
jgi:hypothetical protein